jgi:hypothetical protein
MIASLVDHKIGEKETLRFISRYCRNCYLFIYLFENKDALEKVQSRFRKRERERE